jgi:V8-like Glu-specific endopeptidase
MLPHLEVDSAESHSAGLSLVHVSYASDRRYLLTAHFGCRMLRRDRDLWFTDCDTHAGSSGGPVLVRTHEHLKLAAIMVGVAPASIAVPAMSWVNVIANCP